VIGDPHSLVKQHSSAAKGAAAKLVELCLDMEDPLNEALDAAHALRLSMWATLLNPDFAALNPGYGQRARASCALHGGTVRRTSKQTIEERGVIRSNFLYLVLGALVVVVAVLGYQLYQDRKQPEGMRIDLGPNGLSIEKK
jgi:hypothetical protein